MSLWSCLDSASVSNWFEDRTGFFTGSTSTMNLRVFPVLVRPFLEERTAGLSIASTSTATDAAASKTFNRLYDFMVAGWFERMIGDEESLLEKSTKARRTYISLVILPSYWCFFGILAWSARSRKDALLTLQSSLGPRKGATSASFSSCRCVIQR